MSSNTICGVQWGQLKRGWAASPSSSPCSSPCWAASSSSSSVWWSTASGKRADVNDSTDEEAGEKLDVHCRQYWCQGSQLRWEVKRCRTPAGGSRAPSAQCDWQALKTMHHLWLKHTIYLFIHLFSDCGVGFLYTPMFNSKINDAVFTIFRKKLLEMNEILKKTFNDRRQRHAYEACLFSHVLVCVLWPLTSETHIGP